MSAVILLPGVVFTFAAQACVSMLLPKGYVTTSAIRKHYFNTLTCPIWGVKILYFFWRRNFQPPPKGVWSFLMYFTKKLNERSDLSQNPFCFVNNVDDSSKFAYYILQFYPQVCINYRLWTSLRNVTLLSYPSCKTFHYRVPAWKIHTMHP